LEKRFAAYASSFAEIDRAFRRFPARVEVEVARFKTLIPDLPANLSIVAAPSPTFDAKSALLGGESGTVVLAFAVDTLVLEHADLDLIFPHELFHAYHAQKRRFLNDGVMADATLPIPLWEEGLATYVSSLLNPTATDGQLLLDPTLENVSKSDLAWLAARFEEQAGERVLLSGRTDTFKLWFSVGPKRIRDDLPNRCGYLLGLHVARLLARDHELRAMIDWPPTTAREKVLATLTRISSVPSDSTTQ
jgi:hypothetical protein